MMLTSYLVFIRCKVSLFKASGRNTFHCKSVRPSFTVVITVDTLDVAVTMTAGQQPSFVLPIFELFGKRQQNYHQ